MIQIVPELGFLQKMSPEQDGFYRKVVDSIENKTYLPVGGQEVYLNYYIREKYKTFDSDALEQLYDELLCLTVSYGEGKVGKGIFWRPESWSYDCLLALESYDKFFEVTKPAKIFSTNTHFANQKCNVRYFLGMPASAVEFLQIYGGPSGSKAPFVFNVEIPTREQVEAVAKEKHAVQQPWAGKFGEWVAIYLPPGRMSIKKFNIFHGETISETQSQELKHAVFHVGIMLFWDALVWLQNGNATYHESASQPIQLEIGNVVCPEKIQPTPGTNDPTTKQALIDARIGQDKFGSDVRELWNYRCSVTGSSTLAALEASHIKSWADSNDTERLDPSNGLLLTANLHKLFDAGLISFADSGKMLVSSKLSQSEQEIFGVIDKKLSKIPSAETANYLAHHRAKNAFIRG